MLLLSDCFMTFLHFFFLLAGEEISHLIQAFCISPYLKSFWHFLFFYLHRHKFKYFAIWNKQSLLLLFCCSELDKLGTTAFT